MWSWWARTVCMFRLNPSARSLAIFALAEILERLLGVISHPGMAFLETFLRPSSLMR
jgi:hypothetical protein